jgi:hypothetical protein
MSFLVKMCDLLDLIVPFNLLKGILSEIFELYGSAPHIQ